MRIVRVNSQEFEDELKGLNKVHAFNLPQFAMLNNLWVDEIHFLLFKNVKTELAITFGERDGVLLSPWSAPFGGFAFLHDDISLELISTSFDLLKQYAKRCNCLEISFTLPPTFYAKSFLTKLSFFCDSRSSHRVTDINYSFDLNNLKSVKDLNRNYNRNYKKGLQNNLSLVLCNTLDEKEQCYSIIEENRTTLGYPLKMGFQTIISTSQIINIDFFLLRNSTELFAAAICYWVTPKIIQIIYWGDYTFKRGEGAMHQMAAQLQCYYKARNACVLDVGPSSQQGVPNLGLCSFKESLGCEIDLKRSYIFKFQ